MEDMTLLDRLLHALGEIPATQWQERALKFDNERVPLIDRAVSLSFVVDFVHALEAMRPADFKRLNSYMLTGCKSLDCDCDPDSVENIGKCVHAWESSKDPTMCHTWQFRALLQSTCLSIIETCMIANELTGDNRFIMDSEGAPYFGRVTVFLSYFWQAPFAALARAIQRVTGEGVAALYWIDIFACAQNRHTDIARKWNGEDVGAFATAIRQSHAVVWLHCEPWHNPDTLKRVWCLDEICAGIDLNTPNQGFSMMMSAEQVLLRIQLRTHAHVRCRH
jgi:hypothetical protein